MTTSPDREAGRPRGHRRQAREAALQMLYLCEVGRLAPAEAVATFAEIEQGGAVEPAEASAFAAALVVGTVTSTGEIDPLIATTAEHWRPERMAVIDRLILRMAVYQFLQLPDVPPAVVIDEAVELARRFGGDQSGRFVNGVLDAIRRKLDATASHG